MGAAYYSHSNLTQPSWSATDGNKLTQSSVLTGLNWGEELKFGATVFNNADLSNTGECDETSKVSTLCKAHLTLLGNFSGDPIDYKVELWRWNPCQGYTPLRVATADHVLVGKGFGPICKEFNLDLNKPLFAFIGRLVGEKGAELLPEVFQKALQKENISVLLLGSGHEEVESQLESLKTEFEGTYNAFIGYDEKISHIIYAGADYLLMPSRVEPCGLNQMYALRYGLIPIVRKTGGLKDTIIDISEDGFGFTHKDVEIDQIVNAIERATLLYQDKTAFNKNRKRIMSIDHSWNASAQEYINLYNSLN
jgi:glycosyltransferase involved in cell wall biosynthesis